MLINAEMHLWTRLALYQITGQTRTQNRLAASSHKNTKIAPAVAINDSLPGLLLLFYR